MLRKLLVLSCLTLVVLTVTSTAQAKRISYVDSGLLCIHRYEGAWNDPNSPYWGGLQMDMNFQRAYGFWRIHLKHPRHGIYVKIVRFNTKWGTADHWPIWAQMIAGRHGYRARGWYPWPNTARVCGLL